MTNANFSFAAFAEYGNNCINNTTGNTPDIQAAFKADFKKAIIHAGCPSKDEVGIIDEINDFEMTNLMSKIPELVGGFMRDTQRSFTIPAADKNTTAATISVVAVDEKKNDGEITFGDKKGEKYVSITDAHEELKVKNNRKPFKRKG